VKAFICDVTSALVTIPSAITLGTISTASPTATSPPASPTQTPGVAGSPNSSTVGDLTQAQRIYTPILAVIAAIILILLVYLLWLKKDSLCTGQVDTDAERGPPPAGSTPAKEERSPVPVEPILAGTNKDPLATDSVPSRKEEWSPPAAAVATEPTASTSG